MNTVTRIVTVEACEFCGVPESTYEITEKEYLQDKGAYDAPWHECTSWASILGGGPCCSPKPHRVVVIPSSS